jgi:diguanylate cyclase (GGDEF)-like protein
MVTGEREVTLAVKAIRGGAADYVVKSGDYFRIIPIVIEKNLETARMRRDNLRLQAALARSLADLKRKNRELENLAARLEIMASTDPLTSLSNRRRFQDRLHAMFSEAVRYGHDLACLMIDLDCFKIVNDTQGHQAGDALLEMMGALIGEQVRASDVAARYGGDEFAILLPHATHETAHTLADRLVAAFERRSADIVGPDLVTSMSVGVASLGLSRPMSPHQLLSHADRALYAAKAEQGSTIMLCGPDGAPTPAPREERAA